MPTLDEQVQQLREQIMRGDHEAARWPVQKLLGRHPRHAGVIIAAAFLDQRDGKAEQSISRLRQAAREMPNNAELREVLAFSLHAMGNRAAAEKEIREALRIEPSRVLALELLAKYLHARDDWDEYESVLHRLIAIDPNHGAALNWLGLHMNTLGMLQESRAAYAHVAALDPAAIIPPSNRPLAFDGLCMLANYDPNLSADEVLAIHRKWDEQFGEQTIAPHKNDRASDRRLRVGYVSPDFRLHPVTHFFDPLLANHDKSHFEIVCYSNSPVSDLETARLRAHAAKWRDITNLGDAEVDAIVRDDQIDILVDLTGHFAENRLTLFARKPAPVQVSMIGYPGTTGLRAIDYKISDSHVDPPGAERFFSEKLVRLPDIFWCFSPLRDHPPVDDLPAHRNGHVRFGSVNMFVKVTDEALDLWAQIVGQVPRSTVHFHQAAFHSALARQRVLTAFGRHGISEDRITFTGVTSHDDYIQHIRTFDIALDPFPFNGGTSTCNLMYQGVPIIALAGDWQPSRMGVTMLHAAGLPELIAESKDDYLKKYLELAGDLDRLAGIRASLRSRMRDGVLCDGKRYAADVEAAYRQMWQDWCKSDSQ